MTRGVKPTAPKPIYSSTPTESQDCRLCDHDALVSSFATYSDVMSGISSSYLGLTLLKLQTSTSTDQQCQHKHDIERDTLMGSSTTTTALTYLDCPERVMKQVTAVMMHVIVSCPCLGHRYQWNFSSQHGMHLVESTGPATGLREAASCWSVAALPACITGSSQLL
jgi:hypothetical protein